MRKLQLPKNHNAYWWIALILGVIALILAVVAIRAINNEKPKAQTEPEPQPYSLQEIDDCKREHAQGYVNGYNNGIGAYCETGIDITEIPATSQMCYDTGYERGFMAGVELAHKSPAQCENGLKLPSPIPIDEAELK